MHLTSSKINVNSRQEGHSFLTKQLEKESYALQLQNRIEVESHTKGGPPSLHIGLSGKSCSLGSFMRKNTLLLGKPLVFLFFCQLLLCVYPLVLI